MTLIVKRAYDDTIALPTWLMNQLHLHEGEEVKPSIEGQTLQLTPLEQFLALRGTYAMTKHLIAQWGILIRHGKHGQLRPLFQYWLRERRHTKLER